MKEICTLYMLFWSNNCNFRNIPECAVIETKWDGWDGKPLFCHDVDQFYSPNTHIFQKTLMFVTPYWSGRLAVSCFGNTDVWSRQDRMWSLVEQNLKPHWLKLWVFEWTVYGLTDISFFSNVVTFNGCLLKYVKRWYEDIFIYPKRECFNI